MLLSQGFQESKALKKRDKGGVSTKKGKMKFTPKKRISEANIQAEVYYRLKRLGINCYLEYKHEHCRFDMVIVNDDDIIAIIEFKSRIKKIGIINTQSRQYNRYLSYGLPIIYCTCMDEVDKTVIAILKFFTLIPNEAES